MTNELTSAYMAGFFDGEGYIGILKRARPYGTEYFLQLSIGQKDGAIMDWVIENFGGHLHHVKRDGSFYWIAGNRNGYNVLKRITPYLKYKKPQAELALKFFDERPERKGKHEAAEWERRETIYQQLKHEKKVFTESQHCNHKFAATTTKRIDPQGM